jgi:hypothetical protein
MAATRFKDRGPLRPIVLAVLVVAAAAPPGAAPVGAQSAAEAAMVQTVLDQLAAFRRGDWAAAYGFAAESIRARFTPEAFRAMVTGGYAPIADSARASVLDAGIVAPAHGFVEVRVEGRNGETVDALYEMVEEQGAWRIGGVVTKPAPRGQTTRAALP